MCMMKSFRTFLTELTNRPYPFTWTYDSDGTKAAMFTTEPKVGQRPVKFIVDFQWEPFTPMDLRSGESSGVPKELLAEEGIWVFSFKLSGEHTPAGKTSWDIVSSGGQEIPVMSTVVAILQDMVKKHQPGLIGFTAKESSRMKLYQRFVQQAPRYLPGYVGMGPMPRETWNRWFMGYLGSSPFFLLQRKDADEQITPVTSELHD